MKSKFVTIDELFGRGEMIVDTKTNEIFPYNVPEDVDTLMDAEPNQFRWATESEIKIYNSRKERDRIYTLPKSDNPY